jgi:hypothetical protein
MSMGELGRGLVTNVNAKLAGMGYCLVDVNGQGRRRTSLSLIGRNFSRNILRYKWS